MTMCRSDSIQRNAPPISASIGSEPLGFGARISSAASMSAFTHGSWSCPVPVPVESLRLHAASKVLHYGQQVFEGMKAYRSRNADGRAVVFRPQAHWERFNRSASSVLLPSVPRDLFFESIASVTREALPSLPSERPEAFLYLRPFLIASEPGLSLAPSTESMFVVIASPSENYFTAELSAFIERGACRAWPGGLGSVKVGGNYAAAMAASARAHAAGCGQTLWLDPIEHRFIEEMSGMNVFAVVNGALITPQLTDTILPGITRMSLIEIARKMGLTVEERRIAAEELLVDIGNGRCSEMFGSGTGAGVAPIVSLKDGTGCEWALPSTVGPIAKQLRKELLAIQSGGTAPLQGWDVMTVSQSF